jgi:8-oxo-dGTP pyrophosphatase MutT (NUDIX family)
LLINIFQKKFSSGEENSNGVDQYWLDYYGQYIYSYQIILMESQIKTNKFGDIIITGALPNNFMQIYKCNIPHILKLSMKIHDFLDFQFETEYDQYNVYTNKKARDNCPRITNGISEGSMVALCLVVETEIYFCMVKDRTKDKLSFPCGGKYYSDEPFINCAIRETKEETSIDISDCKLIKICETITNCEIFEMNFQTKTFVYFCVKKISKEEKRSIELYYDEEIEFVELYTFENMKHHVEHFINTPDRSESCHSINTTNIFPHIIMITGHILKLITNNQEKYSMDIHLFKVPFIKEITFIDQKICFDC